MLKTGSPYKWKYLIKKLGHPFENFKSIDDYQKPVDNLQKEYFFKKLKNKCPDNVEVKRRKKNIKRFNIKNGEELTQIL